MRYVEEGRPEYVQACLAPLEGYVVSGRKVSTPWGVIDKRRTPGALAR